MKNSKNYIFLIFFKSFLGVARPPPGVPGPKNPFETLEKQAQTGRIQKGAPGPPSPPPPYGQPLKKTIKNGHLIWIKSFFLGRPVGRVELVKQCGPQHKS